MILCHRRLPACGGRRFVLNKTVLATGRTIPTGPELAGPLNPGLGINVKAVSQKLPLGPWLKNAQLKSLHLLNAETMCRSYGLWLLTRFLGMSWEAER